MRPFLAALGLILGGTIGWQAGKAMVPPGGELETAVYPRLGAGAGILVALIVAVVTIVVARSNKRSEDDI